MIADLDGKIIPRKILSYSNVTHECGSENDSRADKQSRGRRVHLHLIRTNPLLAPRRVLITGLQNATADNAPSGAAVIDGRIYSHHAQTETMSR